MRAFLLSALSLSVSYAANILKPDIKLKLENAKELPFIERSNALSLNIQYEAILELRESIHTELSLRTPLNYFTGWNPNGEAHVTVITPPELVILTRDTTLTLENINQIALSNDIQSSDLMVRGIGHGRINAGTPQEEETFFVIVDSLKLREIRFKIYEAFLKNGGRPESWDPAWFFPHITIGYTKNQDLHEHQGVLKNIKHSWDQRLN